MSPCRECSIKVPAVKELLSGSPVNLGDSTVGVELIWKYRRPLIHILDRGIWRAVPRAQLNERWARMTLFRAVKSVMEKRRGRYRKLAIIVEKLAGDVKANKQTPANSCLISFMPFLIN